MKRLEAIFAFVLVVAVLCSNAHSYDSYWFVPEKVLQIRGAELTLSPSHSCGLNMVKEGAGLAIRFPRFTGRWRDDKAPQDATTVEEVVEMYKAQLKTS